VPQISSAGDSAAMPGNICSNCQLSNIPCTHDIPRQPKKKDTQQAYIQKLEDRLDKMERLLQTTLPERDVETLIGDDISESMSSTSNVASSSKSYPELKYPTAVTMPSELKDHDSLQPGDPENPSDEAEDLAHIVLAEHLSQLSMEAVDNRFFGPSSSFMFVKHAMTVKREVTGNTSAPLIDGSQFRRPLYWEMRPWEKSLTTLPEPTYVYPPEDLLQSLVSIYFEKQHLILPVLHRPTFMKSLNSGQHIWDSTFGMTVLLVCAVASRYSHDPRVLVPGDSTSLSSGWKYFSQVPILRNPLLYRTTIYDIQYYSLAIVYLLGTSIPHAAWTILGLGIRFSLEKGAHRRKGSGHKPTVEDELMKRGFWALITIDRLMSSFLGRPCALQDEDFDIEYPIECDDEYWETEDPEQAFKQPAGKPCKITAFICLLKLCEILTFTLRTLYSTKKSKMLTGLIGPEWEHRIVAELDSSMNKWKDSLPHFLRWDPEMTNQAFFHQSSFLHATYYYIQIQIHRPFLTKKSALTFPSLAMCTSAARSCCHVLEVSLSRGMITFPNMFMSAFASAIVMLLNLWGSHKFAVIADPAKEMENVQKCFNVLKESEKRWHIAGRLGDMLKEVGSLGDYKSTMPKRRRESFSKDSNEPVPQPQPTPGIWQPPVREEPLVVPLPNQGTQESLIPNFATAATMPTNDWDFSNLLMVQMGYTQQRQPALGTTPTTNTDQQPVQSLGSFTPYGMSTTVHDPFDDRTSGMGYFGDLSQDLRIKNGISITPNASDLKATEDMFSLWSEIPETFSVDEWETFLSGGMGAL